MNMRHGDLTVAKLVQALDLSPEVVQRAALIDLPSHIGMPYHLQDGSSTALVRRVCTTEASDALTYLISCGECGARCGERGTEFALPYGTPLSDRPRELVIAYDELACLMFNSHNIPAIACTSQSAVDALTLEHLEGVSEVSLPKPRFLGQSYPQAIRLKLWFLGYDGRGKSISWPFEPPAIRAENSHDQQLQDVMNSSVRDGHIRVMGFKDSGFLWGLTRTGRSLSDAESMLASVGVNSLEDVKWREA